MFDYSKEPAPGWIGGFAQSNPAFAYDPNPDLTSLPMLDNMANIPRIKRQQHVYWPEFSWQTVQGDESSRCFQRFAHNISSIGYDDAGRIWSIICPQQGACARNIGCLNVEVTVTGQRGWVDEKTKELAADMTVVGKLWFSPSSHQKWLVKKAWDLFAAKSLPFPYNKENAIQILTSLVGYPEQPIFPLRKGLSSLFKAPAFAQHEDKAWSKGYIEVQINDIVSCNHPTVDNFNQKIVDVFNIATGNMLQAGNTLTWNLWMLSPSLVDTDKWKNHANVWRQAIDADHGPASSPARYADGSPFKTRNNFLQEMDDIVHIIEDLL